MLPTDQLDVILPMLTNIVGRIEPKQLDDPTPCADFTVRGVLEHMIGGAQAFAPAFRGDTAEPSTAPVTGHDRIHPAARFRAAMADLLDAVKSPGASTRTIDAPFGEVTGDVFARFVAFDGLVHGWDLATATAQAYQPPDDVTEAVDSFARQVLTPSMRDGTTFAEETDAPNGADTLRRLIAFTGRTV